MKTTILLLTTTLVLALVPSTIATDPFSLPAIDTQAYNGDGWAAYKFSTDGSIVGGTVWITNAATTQGGGDLFDASGNLIFGFTFTSIGAPSQGTMLDVNTPPPAGMNVHYGQLAGNTNGGDMGLAVTLNDPDFGTGQAGTYILLLWGAGQADTTTISLVGGAGDALLGKTTGSHAFLYGIDDFMGVAAAGQNDGTLGAHLLVAGQKSVDIANRFYGVFYDANFKIACAVVCAGGPSTTVMTAQTPASSTPDVCSDVGFCGYFGAGAGTYTFQVTQVDAYTSQYVFECPAGACVGAIAAQDAVILGGVDASLPL